MASVQVWQALPSDDGTFYAAQAVHVVASEQLSQSLIEVAVHVLELSHSLGGQASIQEPPLEASFVLDPP